MPELPEVENVKLTLQDKLIGRTLNTVDIHDQRVVKYNDPYDFMNRLEGKTITSIRRRGKFLILELGNENLIVHLGMVGALMYNQKADYTIYPDNLKNHILVECFLDDGSTLIYSDYRRFGSLRVVTDDELTNSNETHLKTLQQMGPEPFESGAYEKFLLNIRHTRYANKPIKDVLLDQRVVAGAGNIYANEALFPLGIHPTTTITNLPNWQLKEVFKVLVGLLELSISMGGSSIRDYVDGEGKSGTFQTVLKVYGKVQCEVCDSPIEKTQINKRATFHCPFCQAE